MWRPAFGGSVSPHNALAWALCGCIEAAVLLRAARDLRRACFDAGLTQRGGAERVQGGL